VDVEAASQEIAEPRRTRSKSEPKGKAPITPLSPATHSRVTRKSIETVPEPDNEGEDEEGDEEDADQDEEDEEEEEEEEKEQVEKADPMDLDDIFNPSKQKRGQVDNEMNKKINVSTTSTAVASAPIAAGNRVMSPNRKIIAQPMTSAPIATTKKVVPTSITTRRR